ncbi:MAG: hypothetical protein CBC47_03045 [Alphaproteobacteria bacterium TMED87]|nr:DNA polymerase III subunit gamma/tau [Rhodospirillaceae bacterium]OUV10509.1 MAG: hypothetical protein CBC47_03045 [Alphaproteobacteria bacterium TMED87]
MSENVLLPENIKDKDSYLVLARKYRPKNFSELVGQNATVRILTNAILSDRVAHAFVLTGVRGTGKTTTARIIARALNCVGKDGKGLATSSPCGECQSCISISHDRHVDVIEMDAASRTGVDDVRELLEGVKYKPVLARNKIYIIDEVHMLSTQAFNALLKTLEEPPPHIKFIFATTEVNKIPITVLSRCQRFDLKRIMFEDILSHLRSISDKEKLLIQDEALNVIAKAADGSIRDALSLLDQAIPTVKDNTEEITYKNVRLMLGLSDRGLILDLYEHILRGEMSSTFLLLRKIYNSGSDPTRILQELLEITHWLTCKKLVASQTSDMPFSHSEEERASTISNSLSIPQLTTLWQLFLKGITEIRSAPIPIQSLEMTLVKVSFISDQPTPEEIINVIKKKIDRPINLKNTVGVINDPVQNKKSNIEPQQQSIPNSLSEVMNLCLDRKEVKLAGEIKHFVRLVNFEGRKIEIADATELRGDFSTRLAAFLFKETNKKWSISLLKKNGDEPLYAQEINLISKDPIIEGILDAFPGSRIANIERNNSDTKLGRIR